MKKLWLWKVFTLEGALYASGSNMFIMSNVDQFKRQRSTGSDGSATFAEWPRKAYYSKPQDGHPLVKEVREGEKQHGWELWNPNWEGDGPYVRRREKGRKRPREMADGCGLTPNLGWWGLASDSWRDEMRSIKRPGGDRKWVAWQYNERNNNVELHISVNV